MDVYEKMDFILSKKDEPLILLDIEVYELPKLREIRKKYRWDDFNKLIEKVKYNGAKFQLMDTCLVCEQPVIHFVGKTQFVKLLDAKGLCATCLGKEENNKREQKKLADEQYKIRREQEIQQSTQIMYDLCDPTRSWKDKIGRDVVRRLQDIYSNCNKAEIIEHIKGLDYYDFLKTPYWKAIAWEVKRLAGFKCLFCASNERLVAHHRDYSFHGNEIDNIKQLVCLCNDCHEKHHDI